MIVVLSMFKNEPSNIESGGERAQSNIIVMTRGFSTSLTLSLTLSQNGDSTQ